MEQLNWDTVLLLIAVVACFWYSGYRYGQRSTAFKLTEMLLRDPNQLTELIARAREEIDKAVAEEAEARPKSAVRPIRLEQQGSMVYLYAQDNGQFLAQAETLEAALALVTARFPQDNFQGEITKEQVANLAAVKSNESNQ